ncbi:MAG: hypothetical protein VB118_01915 [Oscillospiraceae bacterium]|nr:hypothetical protein [Oscillospiraceae bacterium]
MKIVSIKKWLTLFIGAAFIILIIVHINTLFTLSQKQFQSDNIDIAFRNSFIQLCNNLNNKATDASDKQRLYVENCKHAYLCFTVFNSTTYSNNKYMNDIILKLYNLSEDDKLYDSLDAYIIQKLNRLCQNMKDDVLIKEIHDKLCQ